MKKYLTILFILVMGALTAQIDCTLLLGLTHATTADIETISNSMEGSILYNSTNKTVVQYDGSTWLEVGSNATDKSIYDVDGANLYQVSGNTLIVRESGRYDIRANLSLFGVNSGNNRLRTNVNARVFVNGTAVGAIAASGYIRWGSNHDHSSIHINEILQLNANDVIIIVTSREANTGTVRFSGSGESSFIINKLR